MAPNVDSLILVIEAACKVDQGRQFLTCRGRGLANMHRPGMFLSQCNATLSACRLAAKSAFEADGVQGAYSATRECAGKSLRGSLVGGMLAARY